MIEATLSVSKKHLADMKSAHQREQMNLSQSMPMTYSVFPHEIEREIFLAGARKPSDAVQYLLVAKRVHDWLQPGLYRSVDVYDQKTAALFIRSIRERPEFAKAAVKAVHLRPSVLPIQGARILWLCSQIKELTLQVIVNVPENENPLREPLGALDHIKTLALDLGSVLFRTELQLADYELLCRVDHLHFTNTWISARGIFCGLEGLKQLTHLSLHVNQAHIDVTAIGHTMNTLPRLRVLLLWRMEYQSCETLWEILETSGKVNPDRRIVIFDAAYFADCSGPDSSFWDLADFVVHWREEQQVMFENPDTASFPHLPL
ncbi:hypothetical protein PAXRUDRAFT_251497 [Paxillus rubicundulus Ve08.2h10]|uniref:Unplaced genomic scaffold scaffold_1291, whole genome shotgun sequence n=1 Tax=Paxillus rubicundulus Ve08.2h10 TaxID=930991 RepID=A0A0D0D8K5_9AGAM|nr:hypothetical protein PAXRUDRAFT_251497 [Paxillus rubicundulus Ve08.2h10]